MIKHDVYDGKYTVVFDDTPDNVKFYALRYGEPWRDLIGDGLILAMLHEIDTLKEKLKGATSKESETVNGNVEILTDVVRESINKVIQYPFSPVNERELCLRVALAAVDTVDELIGRK